MRKIILNGITWNHSRGISPLQAASQRFSELHPDIEINWRKRSLQEFADAPIEALTKQYDLLIIDHPWVGRAHATNCVLPLDDYLAAGYLQEQQKNTVGLSHESYHYGNHQWALAIDAATQVASYRADLLTIHDTAIPKSWEELMELARRKKVAIPSIPIDLLMCFYMFCIAHGSKPFQNNEEVIDLQTGMQALDTMKSLWCLLDKSMFSLNPISVAEIMSATDQYWYCPFAYGYSNYARKGYSRHLLHYTDLISFTPGSRLQSTIGGTGLSVSAFSANKEWAARFAEWIVSPAIQATLYVQQGGQPGHRQAWTNEAANKICNDYFTNTLAAIDRGYMRPRYNGYLFFQDHAGQPLHDYLSKGGSQEHVLNKMNQLYRQSKADAEN